MNLDIANIAVPDITGKSEITAKDTAEEADIETLRKKVQEMKRKGDPGWKSEYTRWKALREQREQEIIKQRKSRDRQLDAAINVLRESEKGSYKYWESRKWRLDRAMEILQQKGLEFRDGEVVPLSGKPGPSGPAHREPRWKEGQFHRMGEEQRKEPRQPGCKHTKWKWEGSREGGDRAWGMEARGRVVAYHGTSTQPEGVDIREYRHHLGCSLFVGGLAQGTSSGMLQQHLQQFAQVKYCAILTGTHNDGAKAAKITFTSREERNKALAADDSLLEGNALRVRTWACRPKGKLKEREFKRAPQGKAAKELHIISSPPGLGQAEEEEDEESQLAPESPGRDEDGEVPVRPGGALLAVAGMPQGKEEAAKDEREKEEEEEIGSDEKEGNDEGKSEEKERKGNQGEVQPEEKDQGVTGNTEEMKEGGSSERKGGKGRRSTGTEEGTEVGGKGTGGEAGVRKKENEHEEEETSEGGKGDKKLPAARVLPTPDEAEWASQRVLAMGMPEDLRRAIKGLRESTQEALAHLRQHQVEMVCKYWALKDLGINMHEEGEQEARGTWHWNERTWTWEWADNQAGEYQERNEEQEGHPDEEWKYGPSWGTEEWEEEGWQDNPQTEAWPTNLWSWSGDEWKYTEKQWGGEAGHKEQWAEEIGDGHWSHEVWEANGGKAKATAEELEKEQQEDGENEVADEESESEVSIEGREGEEAEGGEPWEDDESPREETCWERGGESKESMETEEEQDWEGEEDEDEEENWGDDSDGEGEDWARNGREGAEDEECCDENEWEGEDEGEDRNEEEEDD